MKQGSTSSYPPRCTRYRRLSTAIVWFILASPDLHCAKYIKTCRGSVCVGAEVQVTLLYARPKTMWPSLYQLPKMVKERFSHICIFCAADRCLAGCYAIRLHGHFLAFLQFYCFNNMRHETLKCIEFNELTAD